MTLLADPGQLSQPLAHLLIGPGSEVACLSHAPGLVCERAEFASEPRQCRRCWMLYDYQEQLRELRERKAA